MPLYKDFSGAVANIFIWKFDENDDLNPDELLEPENQEKFKDYQPKKLLEALMVRKILNEKLPGYKIFYNSEGEPFLEPKDFEISISHSFPFAAFAFSKNKIGVDLEMIRDKVIRVKDKFIRPDEQKFIPDDKQTEYLTIIWSIKESLYKIHHSNYWSLKKHYEVRPFSLNDKEISCRVYDDFFSDEYKARIEFFENYVFTIVD